LFAALITYKIQQARELQAEEGEVHKMRKPLKTRRKDLARARQEKEEKIKDSVAIG
jgi:hypothetical protein